LMENTDDAPFDLITSTFRDTSLRLGRTSEVESASTVRVSKSGTLNQEKTHTENINNYFTF